jgi:hypothetical protein
MVDQEEIFEKAVSEKNEDRQEAVRLLEIIFPKVSDKNRAYDSVHKLTQDNDDIVRALIAHLIGSAFPYFPDSMHAYEDLHRLAKDKDCTVRCGVNPSEWTMS